MKSGLESPLSNVIYVGPKVRLLTANLRRLYTCAGPVSVWGGAFRAGRAGAREIALLFADSHGLKS